MPTSVSEISTTNWQISTGALGEIAQGTDDIAQSIGIILNTIPGSDVLRPTFGSNLFAYLDAPVNVAITGLKQAVTRDIETWEPRVKVNDIQANISDSSDISIVVVWSLIGGGEITGTANFSFAPSAGGATVQPPVISFSNPTTAAISRTLNWQMSLDAFGSTVEGANEISQAISIAVSNIPGTDVLRPLFGANIHSYVDMPVTVSGPDMANAIRQAVTMWEPRVELTSVDYTYQAQFAEDVAAGIVFRIGWRLRGDDVQGQTDLLLQILNEGTQTVAPNITIRILAAETGDLLMTEAGQLIET
jgi:phage baseplate assembly protein W